MVEIEYEGRTVFFYCGLELPLLSPCLAWLLTFVFSDSDTNTKGKLLN